MKHLIRTMLLAVLACALAGVSWAQVSNPQPAFEGKFVATDYNYGGAGPNTPNALIIDSGTSGASGAQTYTLRVNAFITLPRQGGRIVMPLNVNAPILIDSDPVTPSAVNCTTPSQPGTCIITATVAAAHGAGSRISSATGGLQEAVNDAWQSGGGFVVIDPLWVASGGTATIIAAATPYQNVSIESHGANADKNGAVLAPYYNVSMTAATFLAAPTTLTAVLAPFSTTPAGLYTTAAAYFMCVSYVDVMGQEGPCSATFSQTPGTTLSSLAVTAPVASAGAVGYTIYISLTNGTYSLAYQVPITSTICTMTKIETTTPACAVANTTYSQAAANAVVTALTVSTSLVDPQLAGVSGTLLTPAANGRTTYAYVGSSHMNNSGVPTVNLAYTIGAIGSATPISIASLNLPPNFMNQVSKSFRLCGRFLNTDVNSAVQNIDIYWDAAGSNVAGSPVKIGALASTQTGTAALYDGQFCEVFTTTVSGAAVTAGSIRPGNNWFLYKLTSANSTFGIGGDVGTAAIASLNLADIAGNGTRLNIVHTNTTGNATPQMLSLTLEVL